MNLDMTSEDAVERTADLIKRRHPSLDTMPLSPVGELNIACPNPSL